MLHLVNKLTFEAICADESTAFDARHNFSQYCQQKLPAAIDDICTKYSAEDEWIQIDRLEINLGTINPEKLEYSLKTSFYSNLEREISDKLQSLSADRRIDSRKFSWFELLVYFLQKGVLPWWAEGSGFNMDEVCSDVLKEQKTVFHEFLVNNKSNERIWKRISIQFIPELRKQIVELFDELIAAEQKIINYKNKVLTKEEVISLHQLNPDMIRQFILLKAPLLLGNDINTINEVIQQQLQEIICSPENDSPQKIVTEAEWLKKNKLDDAEVVNRILVKYAGIVLFSPFYKTFFTKLNLLRDDEWNNEQSRDKAIHLLRYISTGEQLTPEYELGLEKLLCGASDEPIDRKVVLTENEKQEAQELLLSVIEHWKVLKNTSVAGLRETFLKRDGIITKKEDDWFLKVERKTEDVLLESIPWGYSTIVLPWNKYIIYVEW